MVFGQVSMEAEDVWGMGNEQCLVGGKVRCAFGLESWKKNKRFSRLEAGVEVGYRAECSRQREQQVGTKAQS